MKIKRVNKNVSPHGGIVPVVNQIKKFGIPQVIHSCLGKRKPQAKYGYEDVLIAWVLAAYCGGNRLDHITNLKEKLTIMPDLKIPSHDTLGRVLKSLATEISVQENVTGKGSKMRIHLNQYNENEKMNRALIKVSKEIGALKEGHPYTLHIDATFIETNCATSHSNNEGNKYGFNPMVCLIDDLPVYVSMRNGDTNASFQVKECLENCLNLLTENNIRVHKVISDGAGYNKALIDMLHERNILFNIHMPLNKSYKAMLQNFDKCDNWERVKLETAHNLRDCEIGEINYTMHESINENRIIIARTLNQKARESNAEEKERRQNVEKKLIELNKRNLLKGGSKAYELGEWKDYKDYKLKLVITNDRNMSPRELIEEYNQRGNAERQFAVMKNDFGWKLPPFMNMNENTVFMITASIANNIFRAIVKIFNEKLPEIKLNTRLNKFRKSFINVACALIKGTYEFYNTNIAFEKIM